MTNSDDIFQTLRNKVVTSLGPDRIYHHSAHQWKRTPSKWRGYCPWHGGESGTSFYVTTSDPGLPWYCPGCKIGGGPLDYVYSLKVGRASKASIDTDILECAKELFDRSGVPWPEQMVSPKQAEKIRGWSDYQQQMRIVLEHSQERLWSPKGKIVLDYLRSRGLEDWFILESGLGACPTTPEIWKAIIEAGGTPSKAFLDPSYIDHVVAPWRSPDGQLQTIYFAYCKNRHDSTAPAHKRCLSNCRDAESNAVVLGKSSPYYFDVAYCDRKSHRDLILVEGIFDTLVSQQSKLKNVVGCIGAQFTNAQYETLTRYKVESVTIQLDPDSAGISGTTRCVVGCESRSIRTHVAPLCARDPHAEPKFYIKPLPGDATAEKKAERAAYIKANFYDPDLFIREHGPERWQKVLDQAIPGVCFLCRVELDEITHTSPQSEKLDAIRQCAERVQCCSDKLVVGLAAKYISENTGIAVDVIMPVLTDPSPQTSQTPGPEPSSSGKTQTVSDDRKIHLADYVHVNDGYGKAAEGNRATVIKIVGDICTVRWRSGTEKEKPTSVLKVLRREEGSVTQDGEFLEEAPLPPEEIKGVKHPGPMPPELFDCPGFIDNFFHFIKSTAHKKQDDINFAAALATYGVMVGRRFADEHRGNRTNQYVVGLSPSGTGKNHGLSMSKRILTAIGKSHSKINSISSAPALLRGLTKCACRIFLVDEIGVYMAGGKRSNSTVPEVLGDILQLYSSAGDLFTREYSDPKNNIKIWNPCFSILGLSTADVFFKSLDADSVMGGLIPRFLVFAGDPSPELCESEWLEKEGLPEALVHQAMVHACYPSKPPINEHGKYNFEQTVIQESGEYASQVTYFKLLPEAKQALREFAIECDRKKHVVWTRACEKAYRLALVRSCSRAIHLETIELDDVVWAIKFARWNTQLLEYYCAESIAENDIERNKQRIKKIVKKCMPKGIPHRDLTRKTQWLDDRQRRALIKDLTEANELIARCQETTGKNGQKYNLTTYLDNTHASDSDSWQNGNRNGKPK